MAQRKPGGGGDAAVAEPKRQRSMHVFDTGDPLVRLGAEALQLPLLSKGLAEAAEVVAGSGSDGNASDGSAISAPAPAASRKAQRNQQAPRRKRVAATTAAAAAAAKPRQRRSGGSAAGPDEAGDEVFRPGPVECTEDGDEIYVVRTSALGLESVIELE